MYETIIGLLKNDIVEALIKIFIILNTLMGLLGWFVLLERWMAAWVQDRWGPNRVGIPLTNIKIWGLGQPIADGVKFALKEGYTPGHVDKWLYWSAPVIMFAAAMASFAAIPFGGTLVIADDWKVPFVVAPQSDVGLVYIFALSGLAVYGVIVGGWSSNNKYSFLGGLRASAQLIAYEIP
ncbi:MAG TPA: complex I subunit 1 family protein, partial [Pirellulales bacterium]